MSRPASWLAPPWAGPHVGAIYWLLGTSCIGASDLVDGYAVFDLGDELPPDAFAPIATSDHYPAR